MTAGRGREWERKAKRARTKQTCWRTERKRLQRAVQINTEQHSRNSWRPFLLFPPYPPSFLCSFWDQLVCDRGPVNYLNGRRGSGSGKKGSRRRTEPRGQRREEENLKLEKCTMLLNYLLLEARALLKSRKSSATFIKIRPYIMPAFANCFWLSALRLYGSSTDAGKHWKYLLQRILGWLGQPFEHKQTQAL